MGLKVSQFWNFKPTLPFRFKVEIFDGKTSNLTYFVQKVKLPIIDVGEGDNTIFLGNGIITVPVFSPGKRTLEITFEENNNMSVLKFLDTNMFATWNGETKIIPIGITQYSENMKTVVNRTLYYCRIKSYDEPSFAWQGGVNIVTLNSIFLVDVEDNEWDGSSEKVKSFTVSAKNQDLYNKTVAEPDSEPIYTDYDFGTSDGIDNFKNSSKETRDFNVTDSEISVALAKINRSGTAGGKKVTFDQLKEVQTANAAKMNEAYTKLQSSLKEQGINISINAYNDAGHAIGLGTKSGSHLLGQKIDLNFADANGKKINMNNMSAEQKEKIKQAAAAAGLVPNWETADGKESFWGDFSLAEAMSIDKNGNTVQNQKMQSWTGEQVKNIGNNKFESFAEKK